MIIRKYRFIEVSGVLLVVALLIIFAVFSPSMVALLKVQNDSSQKLQILWFDIENDNIQKAELAAKEEKTVTIYKGESTKVYLNKRFYILIFDDTHTIHYQAFMTGEEMNEQELIQIK